MILFFIEIVFHSFAQRFPVEFFIFLMSEQRSEGRPEIGVYN